MLQKIILEILETFRVHFKLERLEVNLNVDDIAFSGFEAFVKEQKLNKEEKIILAIAIIPYIHPYFFNEIQKQIKDLNIHPSLYFYEESNTGSLLPLLQVALLAAYIDSGWKYSLKASELSSNSLFRSGIIKLNSMPNNEIINNPLLQLISIDKQYLSQILNKKTFEYSLSPEFPAQKIGSSLEWEDLILNSNTIEAIQDIIDFDQNRAFFDNDSELRKITKPGYKVLFFGASGTGKTLTASLIGKKLNKDVYRVDLSMLVSKFIGETEKNLESLFLVAENKNWILFFDEADALFGARTTVTDAHDRYANQEVSFLLQRIENFNGIVILATNLKNNIDKAFSRRFQSVIEFKVPKAAEREKLWLNSISKTLKYDKNEIQEIAQKYEISGGSIVNVIQYASLKAIIRKDNTLSYLDIKNGISKELLKEGKTL